MKESNEEKNKKITELENKLKEIENFSKEEVERLNNTINLLIEKSNSNDEVFNLVMRIFNSDIKYEEYISFKESNDLIKENIEIEELIDELYYNYSMYYSISYFKSIFSAFGCLDADLFWSNVESSVRLNLKIGNSIEAFDIYFFKDRGERDAAVLYNLDNDYYLFGNNFIVIKPYNRGWTLEEDLKGVYNYIDNCIKNDVTVNANEFKTKVEEVKAENKIEYTVEVIKEDCVNSSIIRMEKDEKLYVNIHYLNDEYSLDDFDIYFGRSSATEEYVYGRAFIFGRVGLYFNTWNEESINILKENGIYEILEKYGKCAYDIYQESKNVE